MKVRRPIRPEVRPKIRSIPNVPYDEPLTPGLRKKEDTQPIQAIGFMADLGGNEDEDD